MKRQWWTIFCSGLLSATLSPVTGCSKSTAFSNGSKKVEKLSASSEESGSKFPKRLKMHAEVGEKKHHDLIDRDRTHPQINDFSFDEDSLGLEFNPEKLKLTWVGRLFALEDKVLTSLNLTLFDGSVETIELELSSDLPSQETKECFSEGAPVIGNVKPELAWHWKGFLLADGVTRYATTYSAPVAGNVDNDASSEIVTIVSKIGPNEYQDKNGALVVLDGSNGLVKWNSLLESQIEVEASTTPALIDLDGDKQSEIVVITIDDPLLPIKTRSILALNPRTKSVVWRYSDGFQCGTHCMVAVADLDGDGNAEIVAGNVILSNLGARISFLLGPADTAPRINLRGRNNVAIANLDRSTTEFEIISNGSQVFNQRGQFLWQGECEGFSSVGDLDRDGSNELICIGGGKVFNYSASGELKWAKEIPTNPDLAPIPADRFRGGAPNIGNFDDDLELEIGTAGGDYYVVLNHQGEINWQISTIDRSSHATGSTLFDFNGDGKVEIAYNDEKKLRIYDGKTGATLWEVDNYSGTLWEYPVIVNLDESSSVELVVSAPGIHSRNDPDQGGIKVFRDPSQKWISSRRVWNQYNYFPEIVSDQLTPVSPVPELKFGFRANAPIFDLEKVLDPSVYWEISHRDIDPRTNQYLIFAANTSQLQSEEDTRIAIRDPESGLVEEHVLDGVVDSGEGRLIKVQAEVAEDSFKSMQLEQGIVQCK
jgi:hypothetical protein